VLATIILSNTLFDESNAQCVGQDTAFRMSMISKEGRHLLLDCWNASNLSDVNLIENALVDAVSAADGTLLHIHLHHLTQNDGVSGIAVLAESHISVHTWPERDYAALDIFMCGNTRPELALPVFKAAFNTDNIEISEHLRGRQFTDMTPQSSIKKDVLIEA